MNCSRPRSLVLHTICKLIFIASVMSSNHLIESVMSSNHLILCCPLLLLPLVFPSIRVFSNESVLHIRSFSFSISPSSEYSGLISFRIDWLDLLAVQGALTEIQWCDWSSDVCSSDLWTAVCQASLSITNSRSLLKLMSIKSVMPSNHLILCRPLVLPPLIFPSIRVFSNESGLRMTWPKYWSFSFSISPSSEYSGLVSFRMDRLDLPAVHFFMPRFINAGVRH